MSEKIEKTKKTIDKVKENQKNEETRKNKLIDKILSASNDSNEDFIDLKPIFRLVANQLAVNLEKLTPLKLSVNVHKLASVPFADLKNIIGSKNLIVPAYCEAWSNDVFFILNPFVVYQSTTGFLGGGRLLSDSKKALVHHETFRATINAEGDEDKVLTAVERQMAIGLANTVAQAITSVLGNKKSRFLQLKSSYYSHRFQLEEYRSARMLLCSFKLKVRNKIDNINIESVVDVLLPRSCQQMIQKTITKLLQSSSDWSESLWTKRMKEEITRAYVNLSAFTLQSRKTLKEVQNFKVGQVLPLPKNAMENIIISCQDKALFKGDLGKIDSQLSVRIQGFIEDDSEEKNREVRNF